MCKNSSRSHRASLYEVRASVIVTGANLSIRRDVCDELINQVLTVDVVGRDKSSLDNLRHEMGEEVHLRTFDAGQELNNVGSAIYDLCEAISDVRAIISTHGVSRPLIY